MRNFQDLVIYLSELLYSTKCYKNSGCNEVYALLKLFWNVFLLLHRRSFVYVKNIFFSVFGASITVSFSIFNLTIIGKKIFLGHFRQIKKDNWHWISIKSVKRLIKKKNSNFIKYKMCKLEIRKLLFQNVKILFR